MSKLWGGRFTKQTDRFTDHFHSSISFDSRMYREDITGSMAHAKMLGKQGIISQEDADTIVAALTEILADIEAGKVTFDEQAEDIHMNVETILIQRIGDVEMCIRDRRRTYHSASIPCLHPGQWKAAHRSSCLL